MLVVCETDVTAVEGGRYFTTWEAAVLGLPAKLVVTPASTVTLHIQRLIAPNALAAPLAGTSATEGGDLVTVGGKVAMMPNS